MVIKNDHLVCVIRGTESVLFILPIEVATVLELTSDDPLKFEVKNGSLIIQKEIVKFNDSFDGEIQK